MADYLVLVVIVFGVSLGGRYFVKKTRVKGGPYEDKQKRDAGR